MIKETVLIDGVVKQEKLHPGQLLISPVSTEAFPVESNGAFIHLAHEECFTCEKDSVISHLFENMTPEVLSTAPNVVQLFKPKDQHGEERAKLEHAVMQACLDLLGHMQASGVTLPIPGTSPALYVLVGSQQAIQSLIHSQET